MLTTLALVLEELLKYSSIPCATQQIWMAIYFNLSSQELYYLPLSTQWISEVKAQP